MTHEPTGYTPVRLETVDQVNALPIGTVATRVKKYESFWDSYDVYDAAIKDECGDWVSTGDPEDPLPEELIGWTALTPTHHNETDAQCSPTK